MINTTLVLCHWMCCVSEYYWNGS